ncbi:hypothetical protein [Klebsiella pneumoniae]|uniref:hypothetical protein n=1 Tax=Klebsiella pneumoniae TaxID=573 RepID=UPI00396F4341
MIGVSFKRHLTGEYRSAAATTGLNCIIRRRVDGEWKLRRLVPRGSPPATRRGSYLICTTTA